MMNTVRKSENLLPFPVISAAANGDTTAMCAILKHYEGYIAKLCTRTLKDDAGNTYSYVDEEMRNRLQVRLITRTLAFHVGLILSRLVDTFFSRISPTMQLPPKHHSIAYVLPWAEGLHWQSRSSGCSNS